MDWREQALARQHDRANFDCGVSALNDYLRPYARQNHESGGAKTFVAVTPETPSLVIGYYTISPGAIAFGKAPTVLTKKLGRYEVPVFRLGRLAVSRSLHGRGLGADLLMAAGERALAQLKKLEASRSQSMLRTRPPPVGMNVLAPSGCSMTI